MRCCASPTTSTVRDVAAQFNALLSAQVFQPLSKAMGFYGDVVVAATTQALARSERGGLTDRLESAFEDSARESVRRASPT